MPAMTAREFVDEIAVPTVLEFQADPSQRRGYLACLAAYHVGDYLKPAGAWSPKAVHRAMEQEIGAPFLALQRMANAVKHREREEGGTILMQSGSDTARPSTGFHAGNLGESMNPGDGRPGNPIRFDDYGGRYVEDGGRFFDMLDLCVIALQGYARLYSNELSGSAIDSLHYSPSKYPR
ncbi:hypothetical protein [Methylobacterium sp. AMS5]|uniref:hypothetical protein n=1 Tax=Methylobacterium sp. AMS5 TaxID=925818 RepID=UPI00074F9623|nr:hypothetical protein [Methylobacterium sp. AMS5]AMB48414.1 hypothetical protein Y590_25920 [Methylobacterium sp. AMS5]